MLRIIAFIEDPAMLEKSLAHLEAKAARGAQSALREAAPLTLLPC